MHMLANMSISLIRAISGVIVSELKNMLGSTQMDANSRRMKTNIPYADANLMLAILLILV